VVRGERASRDRSQDAGVLVHRISADLFNVAGRSGGGFIEEGARVVRGQIANRATRGTDGIWVCQSAFGPVHVTQGSLFCLKKLTGILRF
jgi:hypothetical protein